MAKKTGYTITEIAKQLGMSKPGVIHAVRKGLLKATKKQVPRTIWVISAQDLKAYRASRARRRREKKK